MPTLSMLTCLGAILYGMNQKLERNHEETEARFDEQDLTLRGHIGLIEGSLERIEARQRGDEDAESRDGSKIGQNPNYEMSGSEKS